MVVGLNHSQATAQSISLTWERPETKCNITHYRITYSGAPMWGHDQPHEGNTQLPVGRGYKYVTYMLPDLRPYSNYSIQVLATTTEADGKMATLHAATEEAGVGSVALLHV